MDMDTSPSPSPSSSPSSEIEYFDIILSYKGLSKTISNIITNETTIYELKQITLNEFNLNDSSNTKTLKLLCKGKVLGGRTTTTNNNDNNNDNDEKTTYAFPPTNNKKTNNKNKPIKIIVMASTNKSVNEINLLKSDPTIRGFDNELKSGKQLKELSKTLQYWGNDTPGSDNNTSDNTLALIKPSKKYKFIKLETCTWQSFGHRADDKTPHAFEALKLLEKLSIDPGIINIMIERKLVVNTLGEMDPIDDRIMLKKQKESNGSSCLLGYNTNHGLRIDIKLRKDNIQDGFLPYEQLVTTLIHELSHNWVGEHNIMFWCNYGQMRIEYLYRHAILNLKGYIYNGKPTYMIAGLKKEQIYPLSNIYHTVINECSQEMINYGIPIQHIIPSLKDRCHELNINTDDINNNISNNSNSMNIEDLSFGQRLGGGNEQQQQGHNNNNHICSSCCNYNNHNGSGSSGSNNNSNCNSNTSTNNTTTPPTSFLSPRDLALAAAERRQRQQEQQQQKEKKSNSKI